MVGVIFVSICFALNYSNSLKLGVSEIGLGKVNYISNTVQCSVVQ